MQTKQEIERLLAGAGTAPQKRLGQNFLIDLNLMRFLIERAQITKQDTILEVGCGTGSFTEGLAEAAGRVIAVDVDPVLAKLSRAKLADKGNVEVIHADILSTKHRLNDEVLRQVDQARNSLPGRFLLVANLPYHVASPLMINLATNRPLVDAMYVTVQQEVAQRMAAGPGDKPYGTLSIILSAVGCAEIVRKLGPNCFWPRPQVDSAMVSFVRDPDRAGLIRDMDLFTEIVHLFLGHRRKMMQGCVKKAHGRLEAIPDWTPLFDQAGIDPQKRPEQIPPDAYVDLANVCDEILRH